MQALSEDWAPEESGHPSEEVIRLRAIAVGASLCLHILLVSAVMRFGGLELSVPALPSLTIGLVPENPLNPTTPEAELSEEPGVLPQAPEELSEPVVNKADEELVVAEAAQTEESAQTPAEQSAPTEQQASTEAELPEAAPANEQTADSSQDFLEAPVPVPSILAIQNSVRSGLEQQANDAASRPGTCTELQQVTGTLGCQLSEDPDYGAATVSPQRQSVYEFHNPVVERSRTERTLPTIAARSAELATSLSLSAVPTGLADYVLAEVEANISVYSNQGDPVLDNINRMVDQSAAAQIARELNSPWVQLQRQQQAARRYSSRQDQQLSEKCSSAILLIFSPQEIADCVVVEGGFGFLLSPLNLDFEINY